jgi:peptidase E
MTDGGQLFLFAGGPQRGSGALVSRTLASVVRAGGGAAYIGAANGDDRWFFDNANELLRDAGARSVTMIPLAGGKKPSQKALASLAESALVFVAGGDVEGGMSALSESGIIPVLKRLFHAGRAFCGISAGSIMLGKAWVRWPDPDDDNSAELFPCLGLADFICDTHDEDSDWEELRAAAKLERPGATVYGIPSGGALSVSPAGKIEALVLPTARLKSGKAPLPLAPLRLLSSKKCSVTVTRGTILGKE